MPPFVSLRYHALSAPTGEERRTARPTLRGLAARELISDEVAARKYLSDLFHQDDRPVVRGLTADHRPELVPDLRLARIQELPAMKTKLVQFEHTRSGIPFFGSKVTVE